MMPATHNFVRCEAVKTSYRQTKDGMVVSFSIHPNELPPELALAPVGTRVLLAVAEIRDEPPEPGQPKAPDADKSMRAKKAYQESDEGSQAVTRASLLCRERAFWTWLADRFGRPGQITNEFLAADGLRDVLGIPSRREIATDKRALAAFLKLEREFHDYARYGVTA